jgi:hypothetical protein
MRGSFYGKVPGSPSQHATALFALAVFPAGLEA